MPAPSHKTWILPLFHVLAFEHVKWEVLLFLLKKGQGG